MAKKEVLQSARLYSAVGNAPKIQEMVEIKVLAPDHAAAYDTATEYFEDLCSLCRESSEQKGEEPCTETLRVIAVALIDERVIAKEKCGNLLYGHKKRPSAIVFFNDTDETEDDMAGLDDLLEKWEGNGGE